MKYNALKARVYQWSLVVLLVCSVLVGCSGDPDGHTSEYRTLRVAVPQAGLLAPPIMKMVRDQPLKNEGYLIDWVPWNTPDQLRVLIVRREVDFVGMPLTTAAMFREKGVPARFLGASLGNVLHIVTNHPIADGLEGLRGKSVAVPMRGEYPALMFRALLERAGMEGSIRIQYTSTSRDAANQLRAGTVDAALVAEPHYSILRARLGDEGGGIHGVVDIQQAWDAANGDTSPLLTAGIVAVGGVTDELEVLECFWNAYRGAAEWCVVHPADAIVLLGNALTDDVAREGATRAFVSSARRPVPSGMERQMLEDYLGLFHVSTPDISFGITPGDDFFWQPAATGSGGL
ncbi:MAG: ABC transporter substrate-binding protein [Candidatus Sumerlaeia bacterium]|nr:ABC transporter substrate-binding protein [Candidatus Sumerlaeia bacterium]